MSEEKKAGDLRGEGREFQRRQVVKMEKWCVCCGDQTYSCRDIAL